MSQNQIGYVVEIEGAGFFASETQADDGTSRRIAVFTKAEDALSAGRNHLPASVSIWEGEIEDWKKTAEEAGVPIIIVQ